MKKLITLSVIALSLVTLAACSASEAAKEKEVNNTVEMVTIEDSAGNSVEVPLNPEKVAVFDNGQLDNMKTLGLEDKVVLTASPNMPNHLTVFSELETAGSFFEIDLEVTHAMEPDLIIVAGRSRTAYDDLAKIAPTLDLSNDSQDYFASIETNLNRLGMIFEVEDKSKELTEELADELSTLRANAEGSNLETLMLMFNEGSLSVYGKGSRFGVIHDAFGFVQSDEGIEVSNHGMEVSYEYVLSENPDVIFIIDRTAAIGGEITSEELEKNPIIQETEAYKNDRLYYLSPSAWYLSEGGAETFQIMMDEVNESLTK